MVARLNFLDEGSPGEALPGSSFSRAQRYFILLLLVGFAVVLCESFLLYSLRQESRLLSEQLVSLETERSRLDIAFARMTERRKIGEEKLSFIMGGADAADILSMLAFLRAEGVTADELRLSEKELVLEGRCESPQRAQALVSALSVSGLFSFAGEPVIADSGSEGVFSFAFTGKTLQPCLLAVPEGQD